MGAEVVSIHKRRRKKQEPSVDVLAERVRTLSVADSLNVRMGEPHFQERMLEREIDMRSVLEVLRDGRPIGRANQDEYGDWRIKMRRKVAGRRVTVLVAVCLDHVECITTW